MNATKGRRLSAVAVCVVICGGGLSAAGGGGGVFFGYQTFTYPLLSDYYSFASNSLGLAYYGGYGYGIANNQRTIAGGFGMAIMDIEGDSGIAGGFGGFISGFQLLRRPISLAIMSFTGFGGIATGSYRPDGVRGFFAISEEITLEIGIPLIEWFMPTVYAGYQIIGNVIPGQLFSTFFSYTPDIGIRIQWGDFR